MRKKIDSTDNENKNNIIFYIVIIFVILFMVFIWFKNFKNNVLTSTPKSNNSEFMEAFNKNISSLKDAINSGISQIKNIKTQASNIVTIAKGYGYGYGYGYGTENTVSYGGYGNNNQYYEDLLKNIKPDRY